MAAPFTYDTSAGTITDGEQVIRVSANAGVQTRHRAPIPMADDGDPMTAYANVNVVVRGGSVFSVEADTKVRDLMSRRPTTVR